MLDKNEKVIRPNSKEAKKIQKEFIKGWLGDNQEKFETAMEKIYEHDPRTWAKLYIEHERLIIPKATNVNVTHGMSRDMEELMLMGKTASNPVAIEAKDKVLELGNYTEYEELKGFDVDSCKG